MQFSDFIPCSMMGNRSQCYGRNSNSENSDWKLHQAKTETQPGHRAISIRGSNLGVNGYIDLSGGKTDDGGQHDMGNVAEPGIRKI